MYLTTFILKNEKRNTFWSVYANLLHNENKLLKISDALKSQNDKAVDQQTKPDNPITAPVLQYKEGQSVSTIYAVRSLGIDPSTGDEIFLTRDGRQTYRWSPLDEVPVGDNAPKITGNLGTNLMYKGASINVSMRTELGGQMYNSTLADRVENADPHYNVDIRVLTDRWQKPGDEKGTNVPSMVYPADQNRDNFYSESGALVDKGDHIRFQDISFSYSFNPNKWRKIPFQSLQFYVYANNIGILWRANRDGLDPDFPLGGIPPSRSISFGIKAGF